MTSIAQRAWRGLNARRGLNGSRANSLGKASALSLVLATLTSASVGHAEVKYSNGFESGDTRNFDYLLNEEGLSVVTEPEPVLAGKYSLRAELSSSTVWDNGIFRTELQLKPTEARASEGAELYFGWSIYLPKALPAGDYQFGYFETRNTYQQVFSLHAEGSDLALYVNRQGVGSPSHHAGVLEVGKWHRIVYHVKWSADPSVGFVSLWWDGVKLVDEMHGQTYLNDPALVQFGLLKNPPEPPEPVVLFIDEIIEGDSYEDVGLGIPETAAPPAPPPAPTPTSPPAPTSPQPSSPGPTTPGAVPTDPTGVTPGPLPTDSTGVPTGAPSDPTPAPAEGKDDSGCSVSPGGGVHHGWLWAMTLGAFAWLRRRRSRTAA